MVFEKEQDQKGDQKMKFKIETGNESHTTSFASMQAKFHGGPFDGQYLYQQKQFQVSAEWSYVSNGKHGRWCMTVYELPEGTEIELIGKAYSGNLNQVYRLDSSVEVVDEC